MKYKKPLLIVGSGTKDMKLNIQMPFLCTWGVKDKYIHHKWCKGTFGITGYRHGNKLISECDYLIMIGTRMDTHHVPNWDAIAPNAYKVAYCLEFPHKIDKILKKIPKLIYSDWCAKGKPNTTDTPAYKFIDWLSNQADKNDIIIPDMGQTGCIALQRWSLKEGQRMFNGMNYSPMGYALAGAIGATLATKRRIIVIIGDGSLMMNIQDLQTISDLNLPINIFVVTNGGYGMARQTQQNWKQFLKQNVACNFKIPNIKKLAKVFNLKYSKKLSNKPSIYEIKIKDTTIIPKWNGRDEL